MSKLNPRLQCATTDPGSSRKASLDALDKLFANVAKKLNAEAAQLEAKGGRVPPGYKVYASDESKDASYLLQDSPIVSGEELVDAQPGFDSRTNEPIISFRFNQAGARKFGKFTVPEFIAERYYSKTARIVAVICLIFVSFTYVAGQMRGVGIVFSRFLEVDVEVGLVVGMAIVFFYAVLGGMKGITYTQVAQYCVLIFAYTVPAIFIAVQITGNAIPQLAFGSDVNASGIGLLDKLDEIVTALGFSQYTDGSKSTIDVFCITLALMVGTAGLPHIIVRFFTVPKVRDARATSTILMTSSVVA